MHTQWSCVYTIIHLLHLHLVCAVFTYTLKSQSGNIYGGVYFGVIIHQIPNWLRLAKDFRVFTYKERKHRAPW